jgi:mono/diheme cytochrome c family protein
MKTQKLFFLIVALTAFFILGVSSTTINNKVSDTDITVKDTVITGQELYRMNCAGCHGIKKEGKLPTFPSLVTVKQTLSKEQIRNQIKYGKGLMPPLAHLSDTKINAITAYLFNEPQQQIAIKKMTPVELGRNLVTSNCISCHRLSVSDPLPVNAKTMCSMMKPAPFSITTRRFTEIEFYNILQMGSCYMPSFDFLTSADIDAVWAYLKTIEGNAEPQVKKKSKMCSKIKESNK